MMLTVLTLWSVICVAHTNAQPLNATDTVPNREIGDYNFDGFADYRELSKDYTRTWMYFTFNAEKKNYEPNEFLNTFQYAAFDFEKRQFNGYKSIRVDPMNTQIDFYTLLNGQITITAQQFCAHTSPHSEKMDCSVFALENGVWVLKDVIHGVE